MKFLKIVCGKVRFSIKMDKYALFSELWKMKPIIFEAKNKKNARVSEAGTYPSQFYHNKRKFWEWFQTGSLWVLRDKYRVTTICKFAKIGKIKNLFLHIKFLKTSHFMILNYVSDIQLLEYNSSFQKKLVVSWKNVIEKIENFTGILPFFQFPTDMPQI